MKDFINPYISSEKNGDAMRLQSHIQRDDYLLVKLIRPSTGTVTTTVNTLWWKLIEALKSRGITDVTKQKEFEAFVANCVIILPTEAKRKKVI